VAEDAACSVCRFPSELLARFSLDANAFHERRFRQHGMKLLFDFLVRDLGPRMRQRYDALRRDAAIHPTWRRLVKEFDARHDLVERTMIACAFDVPTFTQTYWADARRTLSRRTVG
jgi:hypothetical protein